MPRCIDEAARILVLGLYPVGAFASCGALRAAERGIGSRLVGKVLTSA